MSKRLNPMPPSAKTARRVAMLQGLLALLAAGGLVLAHLYKPDLVPGVAAANVFVWAGGLTVGAVVFGLLLFLMRYQWRWLWLLLLVVELASIAGLMWLGVKGVNWVGVSVVAVVPFIVACALLGKVSRRWFHH